MRSDGEPVYLSTMEIAFEGYDPSDARRRESLLSLGNGMLLLRSSPCEATMDDDGHYPGLYRAGCYNRRDLQVDSKRLGHDSLVNLPSCLPLTFRPAGEPRWFSLRDHKVLSYRLTLDMGEGLTVRDALFEDAHGRRTRLREQRLVSMARPNLVALHFELCAENWSGTLEMRSAIDGRVVNHNTDHKMLEGYQHIAVSARSAPSDDILLLTARTIQSDIVIAVATRTQSMVACRRKVVEETDGIAAIFLAELTRQQPFAVEKVAAIVTDRDPAVADPVETTLVVLAAAPDFAALREEQSRAWARLWRRAAITAEMPKLARAATLHAYHLLQTVSPHSVQVDVGLPSRGWQEAYHGQIFWDEIFAFPFLNHRFPEIARALLMHRFRRLPAARRAARDAGYRGAMYPWRSATTGEEETPLYQLNPMSGHWLPDATRLQRHIGAAIAHNVWRYYSATGDISFLAEFGAEMLVEIARFWASIVKHDPKDDRYDIRGVIGPDEYHNAYAAAAAPGIDNNAYTNVMASTSLRHAEWALSTLSPGRCEELSDALALGAEERAGWTRIAARLRLCFHGDGVISQFEGFERLKPFDSRTFTQEHPDGRVDWTLEAQGDTVDAYQVTKQADLLMLFYLMTPEELVAQIEGMGYAISRDQLRTTLTYYLDRITHESSLSHVVCAGALSHYDPAHSWHFFDRSLCIDLDAANGASAEEGLHLGSMSGTFDVLQRHYLGLRVEPDGLVLAPAPPDALGPVHMQLFYRGAVVFLGWDGASISLCNGSANPCSIPVRVGDQARELAPGAALTLRRADFP